MSKYLIFRTDRIGDYIFSRVLTESIKMENKSNIIDFVCSSYNSKYVKNYRDIRKIYILDKRKLKLMIKNLFEINKIKYDYLIILDGKRRSFFFSIFLKSRNKIAILKDFRPYFLLKVFFNNYFINSEVNSQFDNFCNVINFLNLKVPNKIEYYNSYNIKRINIELPKKYTLLHLDEKWFEGYYYSDFKYMNLNLSNFELLVETINKKFKKNIVITSGNLKIDKLEKIKNFFFKKLKKNIFVSKKSKKLVFIDNTEFRDLEFIVKGSSEIICCEGAISHVSNGFEKKTYALIENIRTGKFWTSHMKNIKLLQRGSLNRICKQIKDI